MFDGDSNEKRSFSRFPHELLPQYLEVEKAMIDTPMKQIRCQCNETKTANVRNAREIRICERSPKPVLSGKRLERRKALRHVTNVHEKRYGNHPQ